MLSYMQSISESLVAGWQFNSLPPGAKMPSTVLSYAFKWSINPQTQLIGQWNPLHPAEKMICGMIRKPSKRLSLFSEIKMDQHNKTDFLMGYKVNFSEA